MKPKLLVLPALLAATMSAIYLLPQAGKIGESAVRMDLPDESGVWMFLKKPPNEQELGALSKDTEFAKASCSAPRPYEYDSYGSRLRDNLDLSIVLSGVDINNSIHRPERCLPAQGHENLNSSDQLLTLPNGRKFEVKRLLSTRKENIAPAGQKEDYREFSYLTYYFFVGHDHISNSHLKRTLIDMKDRLVRGMDQRWAYIAVTMPYGQLPWLAKEVPLNEADAKVKDFLAKLAEEQIDWKQIVP